MYLKETNFLIIFLSLLDVGFVRAAFGGHDLFTSLAQLEVLWKNDQEVVKEMEKTVVKLERAKKSLQSYITRHYELKLDEKPNYDFLGHPINAFHFVRHVASGWANIKENVLSDDVIDIKSDLERLKDREKEKLTSSSDVDGAAHGIVRLYSLYQFNVSVFANDGRISTTLDNGQVVLSEPSVLPVNSFDLSRMALEASAHGLYDASAAFLEEATKKAALEAKEKIDLSHLFGYNLTLKELQHMTTTAKKVHDEILVKRGMKSSHHRTFQYPFDPKLKKKKKFSKVKEMEIILDRAGWADLETKSQKDEDAKVKFIITQENQRDKLCRGQQLRSPEELGKLKCLYIHNGSPWLRLGPMKMEINSYDPFHVVFKDMLYYNEADNITQYLGPRLDFPPGRMDQKSRNNDWTMKNCWPNENDNLFLERLNRRIEHATGLWAATNKNFSEPYMCGNYGIGGHYWTHPDYHNPNPEFWLQPGSVGNRVATILTILDAPTAGGATVWPYAGISVFPEKGSAVFWHNVRASDMPDTFTRHAACPVLIGQKWIGNKWVGYNAQWNKNNCGLQLFDGFKSILQ